MNAQQWHENGQYANVNGHQIFYYDSGIQEGKETLVILHGYPTSSYDYYKVLPYLEQKFRVVIHDHLGFGYSDKPHNYSYSLIEQADMALLFWKKLNINSAHILGHDYGTSVTTEIIARDLLFPQNTFEIRSITLCNGSIHIEISQLRLIQKLLLNKFTAPLAIKLSSKKLLARNLKNIFFDATKINQHEINEIWSMMKHNNGRSVLHQITQYIRQRYQFWHRWIGALKQTELPINIVWAENDPIAVIKMAHLLYEETNNSQLKILPELGHFPMMEAPERWCSTIINSIENIEKVST